MFVYKQHEKIWKKYEKKRRKKSIIWNVLENWIYNGKGYAFFHLIFFLEVLQHWIILPNDFWFFHVCLCFFSSRALGIPASASTKKNKKKHFLQTSQGPMYPVRRNFRIFTKLETFFIHLDSWQYLEGMDRERGVMGYRHDSCISKHRT